MTVAVQLIVGIAGLGVGAMHFAVKWRAQALSEHASVTVAPITNCGSDELMLEHTATDQRIAKIISEIPQRRVRRHERR